MAIVWDLDIDRPDFPKLTSDLSADLVVVGLGGSGLTALLHGAQKGLKVIGIDANRIAAGAAGQNGGLLLAGIADFHHDARKTFGRERAIRLYAHTLTELDQIQATTPSAVSRIGALRIGADEQDLADCWAHRDALLEDGFPVSDYEGEQGNGILIPTDGTFHPAKRAVLLAQLAIEAGAKIYTHSPALKISEGLVTTDKGTLSAPHILVAIDGALGKVVPEVATRVQPTRLQMVSTVPEVSLKLKYGVYSRHGWDYWQQLPDGRIAIGGGRDIALQQEATDVAEPTRMIRDYLAAKLHSLGIAAEIEHHWAAIVGYTISGLPIVEQVHPGVWAIGAYSGTGNVVGALLGRNVVDFCLTGSNKVVEDFTD
jgi:gamma-glutamylputrescine oxidase